MISRKRNPRRGQAVIEFALTFIPMAILMSGTFEAARAVWQFQTLASAVKTATRYAAVRGAGCAEVSASCGNAVKDIVLVTAKSGLGLDSTKLELTLESAKTSTSCKPASSCANNNTAWPASPDNMAGQTVTIRAQYPFESVFWPSTKFPLTAVSRETIQF
jgi:Flp pilus assembly protein TadG